MSKPPVDEKNINSNETINVDGLIEEREKLDKLFKEKFTRQMSVMFTDLKGSTSIAETQGDLASRTLIKQHNDILFPLINKHNGVLVKTMGDGTMSYFDSAQDALRAAADIQKNVDEFNLQKKSVIPIMIRIGIHTGKGIVEHNDIFGDVVNVASRFEGQASPGEICMSEETYNALTDKAEIYCRFIKEATLKGKKEPVKVYKAFWNPTEIEKDIKPAVAPDAGKETKKGMSSAVKWAVIAAAVIILLILFKGLGSFTKESGSEKRTKEHSITVPAEAQK